MMATIDSLEEATIVGDNDLLLIDQGGEGKKLKKGNLKIDADNVLDANGGSVQDFIESTETKLAELEQDVAGLPTNVVEIVEQHNSNPLAHPELSAFITFEADRAEAAAEAASASGWIYPTAAAGSAARSEGEYFWVVSQNDDTVLDLYLEGVSSATFTGKSMVSEVYIKNKLSLTYGLDVTGSLIVGQFVNATNGIIVANAQYNRTDYINVKDVDAFLYAGTAVEQAGLAFYDENKVFISGIQAVDSGIFEIPTNAVFLRACTKTTVNPVLYIKLDSTTANLVMDSQGQPISEKVDLMNTSIQDLLLLGINAYNLVSTTGDLVYSVNYDASLKLPCQFGDVYLYTGRAVFPAAAVALYDDAGSFLELLLPTTDGVDDAEIRITNTQASYIMACSSKLYANGFSFKKKILYLPEVVRSPSANEEDLPILIEPVSSVKFYVHQKSLSGEVLKHEFLRNVSSEYTDDGWYSPWVYHNDVAIAQGNFNFIHQVAPVPRFVGIGHGCEVFKFVQFFADGLPFNPSTDIVAKKCGKFSFQFLSEIYAADPNIDAGEYTVALIPLQVTSEHYMDCSITPEGVRRYNKLIVKQDNTQFFKLYAAMQQTNQIAVNGVMTFNAPVPFRSYFPVSPDVSVPYPPSTTDIGGNLTLPKINKVIAEGFKDGYYYKVQTECRNLNPLRHNDYFMQIWTSRTTSNKCYFIPELPSTVFNTGDVIEAESFTEFSVTLD